MIDNEQLGVVVCVTAGLCVTGGGHGYVPGTIYGNEVSFNPVAPQSATPVVISTIQNGFILEGVSCPTQRLCAVISGGTDFSGASSNLVEQTLTFDPTAPVPSKPTTLFNEGSPIGYGATGLACPSRSQCTAVDGGGHEITFNPQIPSQVAVVRIDHSARGLAGIACPAVTQCTAVSLGDGTVLGGGVFTFNPRSPGKILTL
jgi:hypothetical protein